MGWLSTQCEAQGGQLCCCLGHPDRRKTHNLNTSRCSKREAVSVRDSGRYLLIFNPFSVTNCFENLMETMRPLAGKRQIHFKKYFIFNPFHIYMCVPTYINLEGVKMLVGKENISIDEELRISRRFPKLQRVLQILISGFECFHTDNQC